MHLLTVSPTMLFQRGTRSSFTIESDRENLHRQSVRLPKVIFNVNAQFRVSGYGPSQISTQLAILESLTNNLRTGHYTGKIGKPSKIVHVGHSFGSILTHNLITKYPSISDGVVLTGIGYNVTNFPAFFESARLNIANTVSPGKYKDLDSGYLAFSDIIGNAQSFFNPANLDKEILWYTQYIGQPPAVVELVAGNPLSLGAVNFTGAVSILGRSLIWGID
jgi:pimeloyl-ACP methyl ester carboxylesterase